MIRIIKLGSVVISLFLLTACAALSSQPPSILVAIDQYGQPKTEGKMSYYLVPASSSVKATSLEFKDYAEYVDGMLKKHDFVKAPAQNKANIVIKLDYKVKTESETKTYSVPIYEETGIKSMKTVTKTKGDITETKTTFEPRKTLVGYEEKTSTTEYYRGYISLTAYDAKLKSPPELWSLSMQAYISNTNLRVFYPYILAGGFEHLGLPGIVAKYRIPMTDTTLIAIGALPPKPVPASSTTEKVQKNP